MQKETDLQKALDIEIEASRKQQLAVQEVANCLQIVAGMLFLTSMWDSLSNSTHGTVYA